MRRMMRAGACALALGGMIAAVPAEAKSKQEAWAAWVERAQKIDFALKVQDETVYKEMIKGACNGVTGTVIGQGMAFPMWGQELIGVCRAAKDNWIYGHRKGAFCKDVKRSAKVLARAEPVPEAPEAERLAKDISAIMTEGYLQGGCK